MYLRTSGSRYCQEPTRPVLDIKPENCLLFREASDSATAGEQQRQKTPQASPSASSSSSLPSAAASSPHQLTLKLCDFGHLKRYKVQANGREHTVRANDLQGTWSYCAPEVLWAAHENSNSITAPENYISYELPPSDIFSLGATLFVMLFGTFPFGELEGKHYTIAQGSYEDYADQRATHLSSDEKDDIYELLDKVLHKQPSFRATFEVIARDSWMAGIFQVFESAADTLSDTDTVIHHMESRPFARTATAIHIAHPPRQPAAAKREKEREKRQRRKARRRDRRLQEAIEWKAEQRERAEREREERATRRQERRAAAKMRNALEAQLLCDFGHLKRYKVQANGREHTVRANDLQGTWSYCAPEVLWAAYDNTRQQLTSGHSGR
ncbi:unnamed protein product [Vitrella brassicaformis CCMP3155]|uniref:Protein kinase domain-containing protein n=1 Tax=Vitrella brassicaformis (strain CCMP3155) TaxID=1169540 RepID=A0A0G4FH29_VITBC|nr:unnamed protein product [Vitrella brassicaformis CCMP3155]|eukprot:CEM12722.1 unnamed protein product [Vitrella brassicaformis CCMP3155]